MTDWQRLEQVIRWTGLSTNAFALGIGLKRSENLYQIKRGNHGISKELAELIVRKYPGINRAWLLTGEGDMQTESSSSSRSASGMPYYERDLLRVASDVILPSASDYIYVPGFETCDFAARVTGNALAPEIPAGAVVLVRRSDPTSPILPGQIYLIVTAEWVQLGRVQLDSGQPGVLHLIQSNGSDGVSLTVCRTQIARLYLIEGVVIHKVL